MRWNYLSIPKLQVWEQMSDFITHDIVMGVIFFIHSGIQLTFNHISIRGPRTSFVGNYYIIITPCVNPDSKVTWPTWGPPGSCRPQVGPTLAPWTLLTGNWRVRSSLVDTIDTVYPNEYIHGLCFAVVCCGLVLVFFPYPPQSLHWYWDNPAPLKQPWTILVNI